MRIVARVIEAISKSRVERLSLFALVLGFAVLVGAVAMPSSKAQAQPLVQPNWLTEHMADEDVKVIDLQSPAGYERAHLPGAINAPYALWRQKRPVEGQALPSIAYLQQLLSSKGLQTSDHIILAPLAANASDVAVATRVYWTLKVLGHEKVSILDGGLIGYSNETRALFTQKKPTMVPTRYRAKPNLSMAPDIEAVFKEWEKGTDFVDYRSEDEYFGRVGGARRGTIPGARNLSFDLLVQPGAGGRFRSLDAIRALYAKYDVPTDTEQIAFCNSGHRASLGWFVTSELLGNKQTRLYDGSMAEWSQHADYPVAIPKR